MTQFLCGGRFVGRRGGEEQRREKGIEDQLEAHLPHLPVMCGVKVRAEGGSASVKQWVTQRHLLAASGLVCVSCGQRLTARGADPVISFQAIRLRRHETELCLFTTKH